MKKAISLVVLLVTISVILILTTVTVITGNNIYNNTKKVRFASEISYVEEIVNTYRINNGNDPFTKAVYMDLSRFDTSIIDEQFEDENINTDQSLMLYKIDFSLLNPHELLYTDITTNSGDNIYCISPATGRIYYAKGVKIGRKTYYTLTDDLKKSINYVEDKNVNDGIIFLNDNKGNLKIKIPIGYTHINITSSNGEITSTQESIDEYNIYTIEYTEGSAITVSYKKDKVSKKLRYNVSSIITTAPEFDISEIKTMTNSKTGKEEKYVTLENLSNDIKVIKYANMAISENNIQNYFKTSGIEISKDDVIVLPDKSLFYCIVVYVEDNFGNYNYKKITSEKYVLEGLVLHLDGIQNTRSGHSDTTTVWEDISGNENDFVKLSGASDATWRENSYVGDGTNRTLYLNKAILNNATECTVEVCYDIPSLPASNKYYWVFQNREVSGPAKGFQFLVGSTRRNVQVLVNSTISNGLHNLTDVTDLNKRTMGFAVDNTSITFADNGNFYTETSKEGVVDSIVERGNYSIGSNYPWSTPANWLLKGNIYSIRVYNRKLSEAELKSNYEVDKIRFGL